jgi:hypothetical protein
LEIPKIKKAKNIDNIINKKTISKREKSDNDIDSNDDNDDEKLKPKFKEYKVDYDELNQSVVGKNTTTFFLEKE